LANRRKVSQWDKRMGGDTLANDRWQYLKNINDEYGKGFYIYHVINGYESNNGFSDNDMDLECADGLWNWVYAGFQRKKINTLALTDVYKKDSVSYNNDIPDLLPNYVSGRDEMSAGIIFTPGSPDNFSTNPITRGTHTLYTNDKDYWYSLANIGDRWDGWNVGYNEVFSPYSSPSTRAMNNDSTGIFVWYQSLESGTNKATIKIYRAGSGNFSRDSILHLTPPSRPMGIKILDYQSSNPNFCYPKIVWNHNNEPDMIRTGNVKQYKIYRATQTSLANVPTNYTLFTTKDVHKDSIPYVIDLAVNKYDCESVLLPPYGTQYPVRYYVKAVDKFSDESVPSEFAKTIGATGAIGPDNISTNPNLPKEYSLKQNFPNPFNPVTNIQYELPFDNFVTIKIYDILGKEIITLINEIKTAGRYIVSFNGSALSSGIYYYKIEAGSFEQVKQMVLIK
ncbi:MAG: T9SS type A sorting domain-containing protein, partial [Bacteroidota bacterium]|nr:T9SS type A sorting domain-containing protein [Bacteroidota bacterium]